MTYADLVNKVLRALREDTITTSLAEAYVALVGQYVNEAKEDIENGGPWYALRTTVNSATVTNTQTVDLTSSTNERTYLLYSNNVPQAFVVESGRESQLQVVDVSHIVSLTALAGTNTTNTLPLYVAFSRATGGLTAHFWPVPDQAYDLRFVFVVPQEDMTVYSATITIPGGPVWREALVRAMEERGEEFSGSLEAVRARAAAALSGAILMDYGSDMMTVEAV
jgi:hypothetical protein